MPYEYASTTCPNCRRDVRFLFCLQCFLGKMSDSDVLANAASIREMAHKQIRAPRESTPCRICEVPISAGTNARMIAKETYCHLACVDRVKKRLDEVMPARPRWEPGDLGLSGSIQLD